MINAGGIIDFIQFHLELDGALSVLQTKFYLSAKGFTLKGRFTDAEV